MFFHNMVCLAVATACAMTFAHRLSRLKKLAQSEPPFFNGLEMAAS
jgi:hypothetical protein